jgi:hypothetical protein
LAVQLIIIAPVLESRIRENAAKTRGEGVAQTIIGSESEDTAGAQMCGKPGEPLLAVESGVCPRALRQICGRGRPATDQSGRNPAFLRLIDGVFHATGAVLGLGAHDLEFAHGVAGLAQSGDGIKDDFYGGRSHLSEKSVPFRL